MIEKIINNKTRIKTLNGTYKIYNIHSDFFKIIYDDKTSIFFNASGKNGDLYFKIDHILKNGRGYFAQRYHYGYISLIRDISIILLHNNYLYDYEANETLLNVRAKKGYPEANKKYYIGEVLTA